jgi:hypothetical protein
LGDHRGVRRKAQVAQIRGLAESSLGAAAIARRTGNPRTTVRDWLARGEYCAPGAAAPPI